MANKNIKRNRRALKTRSRIELSENNRLTVFRSNSHIYAQVSNFDGSVILASASTLESTLKADNNGNIEAASKVGKLIAERAIEKGINFFDTAQSYGNSEQILGGIFKDLGIQNDVNIVSKLSPNIKINLVYDSVNQSLINLNLRSLWGLLLHRYDSKFINDEFRKVIGGLKKEKMILNFGVSVYNSNDAFEALYDNLYDIIQVPFNVIDRRLINNDFFRIANEKNKKVFIRSIYLQGLLLMNDSDLIKKKMK